MSTPWNDLTVAGGAGSRVLNQWLSTRDGALQRVQAPVRAMGENSTTTNLNADQLVKLLGLSATSASGAVVTPETALRVSTVYGCVSVIAGAVATMPLGIYERDGETRRRAGGHEYWWLFNEQANEHMTAAAAWEYALTCKCLYGIGYAELLRPSIVSNRIIGWLPHHPDNVQPFRDGDGVIRYRVTQYGKQYVLDSADMLVMPGLGFDGLCAISPITHAAREAVGISLAAEGYSARFFSDGATFDYALKTAANLNKDQLTTLRESILARVQGGSRNRAPLILTGGLEPAQLSINPKDAEVLEQRKFSVEEICRIFGVPPHMVGHTDKTTSWGSGIEQQSIAFVRYTLQRHLTPLAQELNRKLWPSRARYFVEHVTDALVRGDLKTRNEAYRVALGRAGEPGWMTVDEVRRAENMPPIQGGDTLNTNGAPNAQPATQAAG